MTRPGRTLGGKYELVDYLAAGGMGHVWRATVLGAAGFRRQVAIKLMAPDFAESAAAVTGFVEEAKLCAALHHPNIVATVDFGFERGEYYLVMELIDGISLRQCLRERRRGDGLPLAIVLQIGVDAASGLAYAHEASDAEGRRLSLIHRDIKPANIMLSRAGEVKLTDFGIAKAEIRSTRTSTGALKGTLAYMSPEQANGRPVDVRSDIFSLGLVLYEAISGTRAYRGEELAVLDLARAGRVPDLPDRVPAALREVVRRALAPAADDRYPRAGELRDALHRLLGQLAAEHDPQAAIAALVSRIAPAPVHDSVSPTLPVLEPSGDATAATGPTVADSRPADAVQTPTAIAAGGRGRPSMISRPLGLALLLVMTLALAGAGAWMLFGRVSSPSPSTAPDGSTASLDTRTEPPADAASSPAAADADRTATDDGTLASAADSGPAVRRPARRPTRSRQRGDGTLRVRVVPWGTVWLDGRRLGMTPLPPITVGAGRHTLAVEGPGGRRQTRRLRIEAGRSARAVIRF